MSVYDKQGQRIFFQRETTYGNIYDPESDITAFSQVPADYPHWRRLDIIEDTFDVSVPLLEKLKKFDIQDAKHASVVLSGNYEPVDISFEMTAQGLEFLPCAIGTPALTSHDQAMVQTITCTASPDQGDYFMIDAITTSVTEHFAVWADTVGNATTGKPTITGINAANVLAADISGGATATNVATAVAAIINADGTFGATSSAAIVTVTHGASGAVQMAHDSQAAPMGITVTVTTWGSTKYTVTEAVTTILPSFAFHYEQRNATAAEDILYDMFGCVVDNISISLTYGDKVAKYSVTLKCPYAVAGLRNTNNPPRKYIKSFPAMSSLQEAAQSRLLMEVPDTTTDIDRTPQQVDSVVLSIKNSIEFKGDLSKRYKNLAVAGKRDITMQIIGNTTERELFQYFLEEFTTDGTDWYPTSANGRLNSVWKIQRDATYDYITIAFYNWICLEHNFSFVSVDDAVKSVDITLQDGSSNSSGLIITTFTYQSYIDETIIVG